jgi:hypothetical protein
VVSRFRVFVANVNGVRGFVQSWRLRRSSVLVVSSWLIFLPLCSCRDPAKSPGDDIVVWRSLGSWSGSGSTQTDPFISDTGTLRLTWATKDGGRPDAGSFKVTVHSDVSGRPLVVAVDRRGAGADTTFVYEDPRPFFLVVESSNLDWTLSAEEPVTATVARPPNR